MSYFISKMNPLDQNPLSTSIFKTEKRNPNPFRKGERDNFPNLDDAFDRRTNMDENKRRKENKLKCIKKQEEEESLLFTTSQNKSRHNNEDPNEFVCSLASSIYDDVSVNLSIGTRAAIAEHKHFISKHGLDGEFSSRNVEPSSHIPLAEDVEWNEFQYDSINYSSFVHKLNPNMSKCECTSTAKSFCDTSDFFNTSRVNILFTPIRNRSKVDAASRLALMGEGCVNMKGVDFEDQFDESHIDYSGSESAQLDESYLVGMLNAAAQINSSHSKSSPSQTLVEHANRNDIMSPNSQVFNDSFREKFNWDEAVQPVFCNREDNDANIVLNSNFSEDGTSLLDAKGFSFVVDDGSKFPDNTKNTFNIGVSSEFLDNTENSFVVQSGSKFMLNHSTDNLITPISKKETQSYFETPPINSSKREAFSQLNYLSISPMQGGLNSSVIADKDPPQHTSSAAPFDAKESLLEEKETVPILFDDSSVLSSIVKKSSSSERQKTRSSDSKEVSFSLDLKGKLSSSSEQSNSLREFNFNKSQVVYFDHGIEVFRAPSSKIINESNLHKGVITSHQHHPDFTVSKKNTIFTPDTEVSMTPSYDYGRDADDFRKNDIEKIQPKSLLKSFETNVQLKHTSQGKNPQQPRHIQYQR